MKTTNSLLMRLAKRAEKLKIEHLVKSFVDVGPTYTLLSGNDNQILFGRRGTGKTHFLNYLGNELKTKKTVTAQIDMRMIGSTGGIFSDSNITLSERASRLLVDTLINIHETILDFVWDNNLENISEIVSQLDAFVEQATNIQIDGVSENEMCDENKQQRSTNASAAISNNKITASLSSNEINSTSSLLKDKTTGKKRHRVHFGAITKILDKMVSLLPNQELWILIDEWSETPIDLQPYLAEMFRRIFYPINGVTVKIAAIAHRCNFRIYDELTGTAVGLELGADASSVINLDEYMVFDNDSNASTEFFRNLIHRHVKAIDTSSKCNNDPHIFINDIFSQKSAFNEFVRAAEGVPRDAINIISIAAQKAADSKISISCLRESAQIWFHRTKHSALNSRPQAVELLDWIIHEVIGLRHSRGFLLSNEKNDELVDYLYDARVIHLLKQGISAKNAIGKKYTLYSLDYGCYVDLMSSNNAPKGLIIESDENESLANYIEIPKTDYRSIKNSVLELDNYYRQGRLALFTSTDTIHLPENKKKKTIHIEKEFDKKLLKQLPKGMGVVKIEGTIYMPFIIAALVLRKAQGHEYSTASELTIVINEHLLDSALNRPNLVTNNISRELREDYVQKLEWLKIGKKGRSPLFKLEDCWKKHWLKYFESTAPNV